MTKIIPNLLDSYAPTIHTFWSLPGIHMRCIHRFFGRVFLRNFGGTTQGLLRFDMNLTKVIEFLVFVKIS